MSPSNSVLCTAAVVLAVFVSFGESIKCFQCTTVNDTRCDTIDAKDTSVDFYKECNGNYGGNEPFCRKTTQQIIDANNMIRVHRSCGWEVDNYHSKPCYKFDNDFHFETICVCNTDGCNSSPGRSPWAWVVMIVGLAALRVMW